VLISVSDRNYVRSRPLGLHFRLTRRKWTDSGLLIFSRLPIEKQDDIVFSEDAIGLDAGASKGCLYACVRTVERTLHVFNCHLQATHMSEADYAQVRSRQLSQLRDFITTKTFGTRDPWVLTGDFNIDAIATTDERSGEFGFAFQAPRAQSDAYEWLLRSLSPRGDVINLLQETHGRHVCTRPPRLSFPDSASYAFKHKYPQCLDYIFFCNGSVGSIKRTRRSTRVEKFQAVHRPDDQASSHKQRIAVSLLLLAILSIVLLHLGRRDSVLYPSAWVCWRSGLTVGTGCVLYAAMSAHALAGERWYGQSRLPSRHSYDYLSDHFGLSTSFSAEVTYNWQNLAPSLSAMVGDTPVHQQRADQLLAWRRTLSTAVAGSTAALAYAELFGNSAAHYAEHMSQPTTLGLILLLTWGMAYAVRRLVEHTALAIRRNPSANAGGSAAEALCFSSCHPTFGRDPLPSDSGLPLASTVREPPKTVFDCLIQGVELYGNLRCLGVREIRAGGGLGEYKWMSYDEVSRRAENFGAGLKRLALELAMEDDSRGKGRARKDSFDRNEGGADAGVNQDWMRRQPRISGKEAADEDDSSILYAHQPLLGSTMSPRAAGTHDIGLTNAARGLVRGDHIGIVTENCCEFVLVDHACTKYSLVSVTLETFGREFFSKLLKCSEARVIVASRAWMSEVLTLYSTGFCPSLRFVVQVEKVGYDEQVLAKKAGLPIFDFDFVEKKGDRNPLPVEPPNTDDVYTIAYRWHSDNCEPVGWEVTHGNLAANATAMGDLYRFSAAERHFSYVPMSHVGERVVLAACLQNGARIGIFMADQPLIYHDIRKLCPTFLLSTPQGFSAPFNVAEQALERAPLRKWLTRFGLRYKARARSSKRTPGCCSRITVSMIDALIFQKFIAQTGGQVRRIFVLSDATQNYMDNHLEKRTQLILNCPVYKALVLPEVGGFLAVSHPGSNDSATIPGMVLHPELRVKLQPLNLQLRPDDLPCAELLLKGPSLSTVAKPFRESVAPNVTASKGGGLRRAKTMDDMSSVKRVDSVTFDNLDWVHTGIICEAIGPSKVHKPGTWNVRFRDVEETIFSRPAVIAGGQGSLLSPSSGRDTVLRVVGRASSIIKVGPDCVPLLAEAVECVYRSRVNLVRQIWCHAPPQWQQISPPPDGWPTDGEGAPAVGLCAVISVNHEEAYKWVAAHQLDLSSAHRRQDARVRAVLRAAERWWAVDVGAGRGRTAGRGGGGEQGAESAATDAWQNSDVQTNNDEGRQEDSGNAIEEWSIRFTRLPDTGKTYFRRLRLWAVASSASAEHLQMEVCGVSTQEPVETEPVLHEDMAMVCDLPQLREYLQSELDAIHSREDSLPPEARVLRLHLTAEPFHAANKLQTPNFRLCRPNLTKKYSKYFAQR
jgi:acyl-CoA synthetase (AMP-forming)/AMP-acid ligase II